MSYHTVAFFTQTTVMILFIALFTAVVVYALHPKNKDKFAKAARIPLDTEATTPNGENAGHEK